MKYKHLVTILFTFILCLTLFPGTTSAQLSSEQEQALTEGILYFNTDSCGSYDTSGGNSCGCGVNTTSVTTGTVSTNQVQTQNAEIIMGIAKTENLGQSAALIGLIVGIDESSLTNLANQNVPLSEQNPNKQGDGSNGTSLGVFQQQITDDWSTFSSNINDPQAINQLMTPSYAAEAFFGSPPGASVPSALNKGLQNISGWQNMSPWAAAQAVQHSGTPDGSNYEHFVPQAQSLISQYWSSASAVPLPVAINGGTNSSTAASSSCSSNVQCNNNNATASTSNLSPVRQKVVCLAEQELALWTSQNGQPAQYQPGTNAYFKYSQNRAEEWCADFASWLYIQAGDPLWSQRQGNVSYVPDIQQIGEAGPNFSWHPIGSGYTPVPGDLAIHGSQHVNVVVQVSGSAITLVGGDQGGNSFQTNIVSSYVTSNPASDSITGYVSPN
ncbi:MAG: hypothetical protein ACYCPS_03635 [Candidatus Saccharimonadales bacterium]